MADQRRICTIFWCFILSVVVGFGVFFTGCQDKDDYLFNYEYVKELYERTFPVKNIDPDQDWKTTNLINVSVSVNLEYGETYALIIYSANPLNNKDARVLGKGSVDNGKSFSMKINCPKDRPSVFVSCEDSKGKLLVQQFKINGDGTVNAAFGATVNKGRSVSGRSIDKLDYSVSLTDFGLMDLNLLRTEEYAYRYLDALVRIPEGNNIWIPNEGELTITRNFFYTLAGETNSHKILLIDGKLDVTTYDDTTDPGLQVSAGWHFVVGGTLNVNTTTLSLGKMGAKLIILPGGTVNLTLTGKMPMASFLRDVTDLPIIYNAGKLNMTFGNSFLEFSNNPVIYNCGEVNFDHLNTYDDKSTALRIINMKDFKVDGNAMNIAAVDNFCKFIVGGDLDTQNVIVGDGAGLIVDGSLQLGSSLTLGNSALVNLETYKATSATTITGPEDSEEPAVLLCKFDVGSAVDFKGHVYISEKGEGTGSGYNATSANMEYLIPTYNAGISIDKTDCNGGGYNADPIPPDPTDPPVDPNPPVKPDPEPELQLYTFCYEDYYPQVGDYDFNDVVMDMTFEPAKDNGSTVNKLIVNVTLTAVGASYQLGGALQLIGISRGDVSSVTISGASFNDNARTLFKQDWESETDGETNVVIPLFNDAHYVLTGQNTNRYLFNTSRGHENYADAAPVTFKVEVEFNGTSVDDIDLENLDLFIARPTISDNGYYQDQEGRTRVEIHLYQFWENITSKSVDFAGNIAAAGNRTWAICAPDFSYPYEGTNIRDAYPDFVGWAQGHKSNLDWYKNPNGSSVYR